MTITAAPTEIGYAGNGTTKIFAVPYPFDTAADLLIVSRDAAGIITVITTGFSVTGGSGFNGNVEFDTAPVSGVTITIIDDPDETQTADYVDNDAFPAEAHERALDRVTRIAKRLGAQVGRAVRYPDGDEAVSAALPSKVARAGKYIAFDANGQPIASVGTGNDTALRTDLAATGVGVDGSRLSGFRRSEAGSVALSVHAVLDGWLTPQMFGAVGDGVTDDTAALTNWLQLGGGHTLVLPPAIYIVSSQLTITVSGTDIYAYGATIKAKASTNYEKVLWATGLSNCHVRGLTIDVNQANRVASLTQRSVGLYFDTMTDSSFRDCTVMNAIGYTGISGFGMAMAGISLRCRIENPVNINCGIAGKAADGVFMSGNQNLCIGAQSYFCNDTGVAMESSNQSGIVGLTAWGCSGVFAITNALDTDVSDNFAEGITGYDWSGVVTGGAEFGNPLSSSTGNLLNTRINNVTMHRNAGVGPCMNVVKTGAAVTRGLTMSNIRIKGTNVQGILLAAQDVNLDNIDIEGTANAAAIQLQTSCARVQAKGLILRGQFTFGIYSDSVSDVDIQTPIIIGDGVNSSHGVYFANTASRCRVKIPQISGVTTAQIGTDAGTIPDIMYEDSLTVLTYSASMTPNLVFGECFVITATNGTAFTINAPTNPITGRRLEIKLVNSSGGALGAATWNAAFKMSAWTNPANGFSRAITFRYNGANWVQISQTGVDVPN